MHSPHNFHWLIVVHLLTGAATAQPWIDADRARALQAEKKFEEAAVVYRTIVERNPFSGSAWSDLGFCLHAAKKYEDTIIAYQKAVELGLDPPANLYNCACAYALSGKRDEALAWLRKALEARFAEQETLEKDTDLDSLRGELRFAELTGITKDLEQNPAATRDDGWRWDLDFCARRMKQLHWDLYAKVGESKLHDEFSKLKSEVPSLTDDQIRARLRRITASVGDGHTASRLFAEGALTIALPLHMFAFKDGVFIIGTDSEHAVLLGAKVLSVGGLNMDAALAAVRPYISVDNEMGYLANAPLMLRLPLILQAIGAEVAESVAFGLETRDGQTQAALIRPVPVPDRGPFLKPEYTYLHHRTKDMLPLFLKDTKKPLRFEIVPDQKLVYFWFGAVVDPPGSTMAEFVARLFETIEKNDIENLVIDMRFNNGGNTYLIRPLLTGIIKNDKINRKGRLWVIIGRHTFSAAQNTVNLLDRETEALFVGEPTGSRPAFVGESTWFVLPHSRTRVYCSSRYWQYMDSTDERIWVPPDIVAEMTFGDYAANRDPAMEAILKQLSDGAKKGD